MPLRMRPPVPILWIAILLAFGMAGRGEESPERLQQASPEQPPSRAYLGFDRNDYPGDAALATLRKSFSFSGYWLNAPPGERTSDWNGKREILNANGFGFLVL